MARKLLLPRFELTELTDEGDSAATKVEVAGEVYYVRSKLVPDEGKRRDGKPRWVKHQFNLYPVVLDSQGIPWAEANVYLLSRLEGVLNPVMSTYAGVADDLAAYRRFLDEHDIDWAEFPAQKLSRPTYRFNGHLKFAISAGETAAATAKRRMSTVVNFYRWLGSEGVFTPANPAWKESDHYVQFQNAQGFQQSKKVTTTDVHVKAPKQTDPYDGLIEDGTLLVDRETTIRRFKKGELAYKETFLGGCTSTEVCTAQPIKWLDIDCVKGCKNMVGRASKLDRAITAQSRFVESLDPSTPEFRTEQADLQVLLNARQKVQERLTEAKS